MTTDQTIPERLNKAAKWLLIIGILVIVVGIIGLVYPQQFGEFSAGLIGIFLVIGGFLRMIFAGATGTFGNMLLRWLLALLMVVAGVWVISNPEMGLQGLTLIMGIYFIIDGIMTIFYSFSLRSFGAGSYLLINGLLSIAIGVLIFSKWPESSEYAIGIYLGIKLIFDGAALAITGYVLKKSLGGVTVDSNEE